MQKEQSFFTKVNLPKGDFKIDYQQPIFLIGSCFSMHIGNKLKNNKFNILTNPCGIIYNPISIVQGLKRIFKEQLYVNNEVHSYNNKWFSFDHHSSFSSYEKTNCLEKINAEITGASAALRITKTIVITLGSAWVYEYENVGIVANCHKIPNKNFKKRLLSVKEIISAFEEIKKELSGYNIIFTVSPIRHSKEGLHENNLSKATLLLGIDNLVKQNSNYNYFPAYELVIDELRDYRFFKDDLVHPTKLAINYVWEKFMTTFCDDETIVLIEKISKIKNAVKHKPFAFESKAHQLFINKQIQLMDELTVKHPFLDFKGEKMQIIKD
jgi:hypothetical protein